MIKFLLNDSPQEVTQVCPNTTVLDYLRLKENATGTKEGCASGDCGACTVVVGEAVNNTIQYKSINSCISLIGSLHGKQLVTVEHLQDKDLHPVQQAMVDCHGSQCGFCTPGFVMSLFSLYQNETTFDDHDIEQHLAGNLCRCTGYKPIIDAAKQVCGTARDDQFIRNQSATLLALESLREGGVALEHNGKRYFSPTSNQELSALLAEHKEARLCAGTTDLALEITQQLKDIESLVFTGSIDELKQIQVSDSHIEIGSAVTYEDAMPVLQEHYPAFVNMLLRLGSKQVRNVGTFGGNIGNASPIGDTPPCFIALNAELVLESAQGERRLKIDEYFLDYKKTSLKAGEFIAKIRVPKLLSQEYFKTYKISKRIDDDISAVAAAFKVRFSDVDGRKVVDDVRLSFGGMAGVPKRAAHAESALLGSTWSESSIGTAMQAMEQDFTPLSDVRASASYRMQVAKNLLYKYYLESQADQKTLTIENVNVSSLMASK